jgi:hypothetical protein
MRPISRFICAATLMALANVCLTSTALAQRPYRETQANMRDLIGRIQTHSDTFKRSLESGLDRRGQNRSVRNDDINRVIADFESATNQLKIRFENRQSTSTDARLVLDRASQINNFLVGNRLESGVDRNWRLLQADLDQLARAYYIDNWRWDTTSPVAGSGSGPRLSDLQMRQLIRRIQNHSNQFSRSFMQALNQSSLNGTSEEREANGQLSEFESATSQLGDSFNRRAAAATDVQNVLEHAAFLNAFIMDHRRLDSRAQSDWTQLKGDLDQLASAYDVAWNWNPAPGSGGPGYGSGSDTRLTGTYRLNASQGDNPRVAAENASRSLPAAERQRVNDSLIRRLDPPDALAIDRRGNNVTIASSRAPQINFVADGSEHVETTPNGRTVRVRASFSGDQLNIARSGERAQDFTVTFDPGVNGRRLIVTRRLYSDQLDQPVTVRSYYDKTADVAQLDIYRGSPDESNVGTASGDFVVPNGTELVAALNTNLATNTAHDNDRFTMTVRSPSQYEGATIEGYVTNVNRSGRITGRSEMTLNFDSIRLRDGRTNRFAGILETVRTEGGETVRVDNEGAVKDDDQTKKTVQRTAIGTALGAIIGAIAGGGKGAAIGAVVGAGAGAGSVYVQGQNDLNLTTGTEVTIRSTGPR